MISILAAALGMAVFLLLAASLGYTLLTPLIPRMNSDAEHLLCCLAAGVVVIQLLTLLALPTHHIPLALIAVLVLVFLVGMGRIPTVVRQFVRILQRLVNAPTSERLLSVSVACVVLIEFLAAMAPLTASDALHYHFAVPAQILQNGFHANFFLSHSFFCGQSHLLILLGLALGGERLAMGLVFLGGILAAAATACLARRWTDRSWACISALVFLLTPLVFWQVASPGAPDLWMSFFTIIAVLLISKARESASSAAGVAIFAGCLAGAIAGAKYTGCFIAASLLIALLVELRSLSKALLFTAAAVATGVWPYLRNIFWAGDPFFPFLLPRLSPQHVNSTALAFYLADTGSGVPKSLLQFFEFILFTRVDPGRSGFFQFFGPLVLAFSPLLFRSVRNTPLWRTCLIAWIVSAATISLRSGMVRFLLAVFPVALVAVIASVFALKNSHQKLLRLVSGSSIALSLSAGFFGLLVYAKNPIKASLGFTSNESYLRRYSPDYQADEFANQFFAGHPAQGNVLVFMRHVYYLKIPYLYADPKSSWAIDPSLLQTPEQWRTFLARNNVAWVVRNPVFPASISVPLDALEKSGDLFPVASAEVENFRGKRFLGQRERSEIVLLQVKPSIHPENIPNHPN